MIIKYIYILIKAYINIISAFIPNKEKRKAYRLLRKKHINDKFSSYIDNKVSKLKWGVSYSVFDGEELLESSLLSIRKNVDYINVVYQTKSWYGEDCVTTLEDTLYKLKNIGLIDELIEYKPNLKKSSVKQEIEKRNLGLEYIKKAKCNYFMTMDCDEFFDYKELEKGKKDIVASNITYSYCNVVNYSYLPTIRLLNPSGIGLQFFCKVNFFTKLGYINRKTITTVDQTRVIHSDIPIISLFFNFNRYYFLTDVNMHHMSLVRYNLEKKFNNSSYAALHNTKISYKITDAVLVPDYFGILDKIFFTKEKLEFFYSLLKSKNT